MKKLSYLFVILIAVSISSVSCGERWNSKAMDDASWMKEFNLDNRTLISTGKNDYFILEPGFQLVLESNNIKLVITVLDETKEIMGITTRIVEEREWKSDNLYEVARNFFAIDEKTKDVFYFGEEVDFYKNNKIVGHRGAWLAGEDGATPGLIMPGKVELGMKYYQEVAPEKAMDRAEIIDLNHTLETPAGTFTNCVKTKEGSALKLWEKEFKSYAAGIGLIQDQYLLLTSYGFIDQK